MEHEAWQCVSFAYPNNIPTMLSQEERIYLYWLSLSQWSGKGNLLEIGPWLGESTVCLAKGMQDSHHNTLGKLDTFENFIWREFMASRVKLPLLPGESFYSDFSSNICDYKHIISSHISALPDEEIKVDLEAHGKRFREEEKVPVFKWESHESIETLFLDGAMSLSGIRCLFSEVKK